ncbi:hypothetical protein [Desulfotomaculum nigrificans]|uniref:hypothetical protein n=1 Tax=Desulfotomaculum nigrificans TaxID=1565 RepID=UPI0001FAE7CF|nr:hypothetical protein [Desulfotomaculum nigrificans]
MYWLRTGSILDLTVIATNSNIADMAKLLDIPYSTLVAYIAGTRYIRESAVPDFGCRWGKYIDKFLGSNLSKKEIIQRNKESILSKDHENNYDYDDIEETSPPELEPEVIWSLYFTEMATVEYNLRYIVEHKSWSIPFGCCAAQVLARFEASQPELSKLETFTKDDAIHLLKMLFARVNGRTLTKESYQEMLNLALRYILWRVKTREYYKLEKFYPIPRCIEIRDARPIILLQQRECDYVPDHRLYHGDFQLPDTPCLKKAATLDVLMLCRSVEVKIDNSVYLPKYYCSCTSPSNDFICFEA